jgi:putative ABC transport system substrate-binding protein
VNLRRRIVLAASAALALAAAPVRAQKVHRVGLVLAGQASSAEARRFLRAFVEGMRELGYEEPRNLVLDVRYYGGDRNRIAVLADSLIASNPDVLVANFASTASVLKESTSTLPIVVASGLDPVGEGLAASLERPGENVTGLTSLSQAMHAQLIELAHSLLPRAKRIAFLVNPAHAAAKSHEDTATRSAKAHGLELVVVGLRAAAELDGLTERLAAAQAQALVVSADVLLFTLRERIVRAATRAGMPTLGVLPQFAARGAVAAYGPDVAANFRAAARYVDRILKGAKPGELPMEPPKQFELVLNLKTANAFRITVPKAVLLRADRVIE